MNLNLGSGWMVDNGREISPRASHIPLSHRTDIRTEIWMGGADSAIGELLTAEHLRGAWLVDCAGEFPSALSSLAEQSFMRVFADVETVPSQFPRIAGLARELALRLSGQDGAAASDLPERLYVMCSQGFNRSGLVAGLILRELGATPEEALAAVRKHRPGSLANATFVRLLFEGLPE